MSTDTKPVAGQEKLAHEIAKICDKMAEAKTTDALEHMAASLGHVVGVYSDVIIAALSTQGQPVGEGDELQQAAEYLASGNHPCNAAGTEATRKCLANRCSCWTRTARMFQIFGPGKTVPGKSKPRTMTIENHTGKPREILQMPQPVAATGDDEIIGFGMYAAMRVNPNDDLTTDDFRTLLKNYRAAQRTAQAEGGMDEG